jgi:hypothetical protein
MPEQNPAKPPMSPRAKRYWGSWIASGIFGILTAILLKLRAGTLFDPHPAASIRELLNMSLAPATGLIFALLWGICMTLIMVVYLRNVDEQEMHANLWAGLLGSNAALIGIPAWHILWMGGFLPPVDGWAIFLLVLVVNGVTLVWLKFRR